MPRQPAETSTKLYNELTPAVAHGLAKRLADAALAGDFTIKDILEVLGLHIASAAQDSMHQQMQPFLT